MAGIKKYLGNWFYVLVIIGLLTFWGCREEIIIPNNPAGNKNVPVKSSSANRYTFSINAENVSFSLIDRVEVEANNLNISSTLSNYQSGSVQFWIFSNQNRQIFYDSVQVEGYRLNTEIQGEIPEKINMTFINFTGNFSLELKRLR